MSTTTPSPSQAVPSRSVRKDAVRNRALLLDAADAMIREHGIELSLNAVARHAGVGVGTVYRHFPDREALIDAMFEQRVEQLEAIFEEHLRAEDPVAGLLAAILHICELQAADRGLWEVVSAGNRDVHREIVQERVLPLVGRLVGRANATGRLRMTFEATDMPVLLWAGGALNAYLGHVSPASWRRYVELVFNGFLRDDDPARRTIEQRSVTLEEFDAAVSAFDPRAARGHASGARNV